MAYPYDFPDQKPLRYRPRRKVKAKLPFPFLGVDNTPDGIKILAQMPGVIGLVDPALLKTLAGLTQTMLCRVTGAIYTSVDTALTTAVVGKSRMATPALHSGFYPDSQNTIVLPEDRWTLSFAIKPFIAAGLQYIFGPPITPVGAGPARFAIAMNSNKVAILDQQPTSATRLASATTFANDNPVVITITFSIENGLHIYINGVLDASDVPDNAPLSPLESERMFQIGAFGTDHIADFRGGLGLCFFAEEDYFDPRFDKSRNLVTAILKDRYGIA